MHWSGWRGSGGCDMDRLPRTRHGAPLRHIWTYRSPTGEALAAVARYDEPGGGKQVIPFRPDGSGWKPGALPEPRPLFELDTLTQARPDRAVLIVEGEKSAAALRSLGLLATTSQGGSKAAGKSDWSPLKGRERAYVLPDNDVPGETYAMEAAALVEALERPPAVYLVDLPGLPDKGDVVDWLQARLPRWDGYSPIPEAERGRLRLELEKTIKAHARPAPGPATGEPEAEALPTLVPLDSPSLPRLDLAHLPGWAGNFARALAEATETPPELAAGMVIAACATAAARRLRVMVKPGYFEPCNIWVLVALPSDNRKSAVQEAAAEPLLTWEREKSEAMDAQIRQTTSERKTLEARAKELRNKAAKADSTDKSKLFAKDAADIEADLPEIPISPALWTSDAIPEQLGVLLADQEECMAWLSSEGGLFDLLAGRYSNKIPNLDLMLKAHGGDAEKVNRGSRPTRV